MDGRYRAPIREDVPPIQAAEPAWARRARPGVLGAGRPCDGGNIGVWPIGIAALPSDVTHAERVRLASRGRPARRNGRPRRVKAREIRERCRPDAQPVAGRLYVRRLCRPCARSGMSSRDRIGTAGSSAPPACFWLRRGSRQGARPVPRRRRCCRSARGVRLVLLWRSRRAVGRGRREPARAADGRGSRLHGAWTLAKPGLATWEPPSLRGAAGTLRRKAQHRTEQPRSAARAVAT